MAGNRKTIDTDLIYIREVYARTAFNQTIPENRVLVANGDDSTRWDYIRISTFNNVVGDDKVPLYADANLSTLNIITAGPPGLLTSYADLDAQALILSAAPPVIGVSQRPVTGINSIIAASPPNLVTISNYSTLNFIGVNDVLLSTVTDSPSGPSVFISISSFTSAGYSTISGEAFGWRPYMYNLLSTAQGLPTVVSSIPTTWPTGLQNISTAEPYPNYTTGDAYFSSVSINMSNYIGYINPGITNVVLEVEPNYLLPRFLLGTEEYPTLFKNISSYIQYTSATSSFIINGSQNTDVIVSQQSNVNTSNYFNKPMKLPIDSRIIASNWLADGAQGYYTLFHRIPGGMAQLIPGDACGYYIGSRGGMSNDMPTYINATPLQNGAFIGIYNTISFLGLPINLSANSITQDSFIITWEGSYDDSTYDYTLNGNDISYYNISVDTDGRTATFTGAGLNTSYSVVVIATHKNTPLYSAPLSVITLPNLPLALTVSQQSVARNAFTIFWTGGTGATSYTFSLNGSRVTPNTLGTNTANFTGLSASTPYIVIVTATNRAGSVSSSPITITTTS